MRIQHFCGYGAVNAKAFPRTINRETGDQVIPIKVWGDHEQSLYYKYGNANDLAKWLGGPRLGNFKGEDVISWDYQIKYEPTEEGSYVEAVYYSIKINRKHK